MLAISENDQCDILQSGAAQGTECIGTNMIKRT